MSVDRGGGKVRVIGGTLRGSRVRVPDSTGLRPTPSRVRETLFNWLQPVLPGARVLDLFAGSGVLGLEALSRGCAAVTFVERDRGLCQGMRDNLQRLRQSAATVVCADAVQYLETGSDAFDIVFMDPPFAGDLWSEAAERLEACDRLAREAWVYVERPPGARLDVPRAWRVHRETRAGQVHATLYRRMPVDPLS